MHCSYKLHVTPHQNVWGMGQDWSGLHRFFYWVWKYTNQQRHRTKPCSHLASLPLGEVPSHASLLCKTETTNTFQGSSTYHTTKEHHLRKSRTKHKMNSWILILCSEVLCSFKSLIYYCTKHFTTENSTGKLSPSHPFATEASRTHSNFNHWAKGIFRQRRLLNGINEQKHKLKQP